MFVIFGIFGLKGRTLEKGLAGVKIGLQRGFRVLINAKK
jgi:hypothetical protein